MGANKTRVLKIEIKNCRKCPYFSFNPGSSYYPYPIVCNKTGRQIDSASSPNLGDESYDPPKWCPLDVISD
jgi:hypothetical protein